ncbi:MAG: glycogen debranching protein GlgX [Desulfobulbaceae bacterium]|nr:MAG: glycogen debranching protein GlgX [Desulfobulbaceae bacterium]
MSSKSYPFQVKRGNPLPLGIYFTGQGYNFAVFSRHATEVTLVLDSAQAPGNRRQRHQIALDPNENRTGDIWHVFVETGSDRFTYGYRMNGPATPEIDGCIYDSRTILIDPYCHRLLPRKWGDRSTYGRSTCCMPISPEFDWQGDRPLKIPWPETVIYEIHPRGYTRHPSSGSDHPGTYLGIADKIPYLQALGITAVELMPVTEFDENDIAFANPDNSAPLKNFWGYSPVSFHALKSGYAFDCHRHIDEFKFMVKSLHRAGIEIILDIVFNHTGEGGYNGITSSFRGIDNPVYYLLDQENRSYLNFSGCGNTLNCNHPVIRSLIRDTLRFWVIEMHVDGFRFDLASILGRDRNGQVLANPPVIEMIAEDPVLRDTKIIAEAWDAAGLYQVGSFSNDRRWAEWNGRFRDDVRAFMAGHEGTVTRLATRIAGSSDLYQTSSRSPLSSINFLTSHDGFTLYDLVSYEQKRNRANGEDNRDGENHNISWNSGCEGDPASTAVMALRFRRIRSMATILFLSQGIPMITAGDEFGRSQLGNNNAWCQDNPTGWVDWTLADTNRDLLRFFRRLIDLRKRYSVFRREDFFRHPSGESDTGPAPEISWQYLDPGQQNWAHDCQGLAFILHGQQPDDAGGEDFFIMINGSRRDALPFTLPDIPGTCSDLAWYRIIDTAAVPPDDFIDTGLQPPLSGGQVVNVLPQAVVVLQSAPVERKLSNGSTSPATTPPTGKNFGR